MDTNKWKSVLVTKGMYEELKALAEANHRTLGGQLRLIIEWHKKQETKIANSVEPSLMNRRDSMIVKLIHEDHISMINVAKIFGISHQRVEQIYREGRLNEGRNSTAI